MVRSPCKPLNLQTSELRRARRVDKMPHGNVTGVSKDEAKLLDVHLVANQQALLEKVVDEVKEYFKV